MSKLYLSLTAVATAALLVTIVPALEANLSRSEVKGQAHEVEEAGETTHGQDVHQDEGWMSVEQHNEADDVKDVTGEKGKHQAEDAGVAGTVGSGDTLEADKANKEGGG